MTDRASIIEKAAKAMCPYVPTCMNCQRRARLALDAIAPPGEAWIAPVQITLPMLEIGSQSIADDLSTEAVWGNMMMAFLSDKGKG